MNEPLTSKKRFPFYGHDDGLVIEGPDTGFKQTPMTPAQLAAREPALAIAQDIYRFANYAGVCYVELWGIIAKAIQGALDARAADEPSALLLVPCPRCGGTGKLKPYKLEGDTEWRVADCPEKHVTAEPPVDIRPIETAPKDELALFWIVAKTAEESYTDTSGNPIVALSYTPHWELTKLGRWSSLLKATHWSPLPGAPSTKSAVCEHDLQKPSHTVWVSDSGKVARCSACGQQWSPVETEATQVTTYEVGETSGVCKHCGLSWLLHIAEDDRGRKNVCAPIKRAESENARHD